MIKESIENFGDFEFYEDYFIGRIHQGVDAGSHFIDALSELIQKHFARRPVIYISDRVNSYSLDPRATSELIERNDIRFTAVVTYNSRQNYIYSFEEHIIKGTTMCIFDSLESAVEWARQKAEELK